MTKTFFTIDGFAFYLTWNAAGTVATDQRGGVWTIENGCIVSEGGSFAVPVPAPVAAPRVTGKPKEIRVSLGLQSIVASYAHREKFGAGRKATGPRRLALLGIDKGISTFCHS